MVAFSAILQTALGLSAANDLTSLFGPYLSPQAEILNGNDTNFYAQLQQRWTDYKAPSYGAGAIKPATAKDVQNIVKIANANSIPFFVTGGGHGISDYHNFDGLSIDMGKFNTVERNAAGDRLTIGGAVKIHQLTKPLAEWGKELPLGSCACVGVVGATLGGGIGSLHGLRGLLADYLEEVEVVTASGDLIKASETEHKDLFWALRGAGSNYGIVTSATYRLPEVTNKGVYVNADYVFPVSANQSFFEVLEQFDNTLPPRLAITGASFFDRVNNKVNRPWKVRCTAQISDLCIARDRCQCCVLRSARGGTSSFAAIRVFAARNEECLQYSRGADDGRGLLQLLRNGQRRLHPESAHQHLHRGPEANSRSYFSVLLFKAG